MKKINLHFSSTHRGPGKVVENLAKGLSQIGIEVTGNLQVADDAHQGCLQAVPHLSHLPKRTLMGPNLFIFPSEWGEFCKRFSHYIVPSDWVLNKYSKYGELSRATIDVWPVGIDTELWRIDHRFGDEVLVYFKSREESELEKVTSHLKEKGINYNVIRYGSYQEKDLYLACARSSSCVLITGTESQGVAYMQILSTGIPCFVMNKSSFDYFHYKDSPIPSTSVPYFSDACGTIADDFSPEAFEIFHQN